MGRAPEHHNWGYSWLLSFCPSYTSPPCPLHSLSNFSCSSLDPGAPPQPLCLSPPGVQPTPCPNSTLGFDLPSAGSTSVTSTAGDKGGGDPGAAASAPAGEREFQVRQVWPGCSAHPCWPWQPHPGHGWHRHPGGAAQEGWESPAGGSRARGRSAGPRWGPSALQQGWDGLLSRRRAQDRAQDTAPLPQFSQIAEAAKALLSPAEHCWVLGKLCAWSG